MDENDIKIKYQLSDNSYEKVLRKLAGLGAVGATTREKVGYRNASRHAAGSETPRQMTWKCPACGTPQPREYDECPQCGIITAKYTALQDDSSRFSHRSMNQGAEPDKRAGNKAVVIAVSILFFIGLGAAFLKFTSSSESSPKSMRKNFAARSVPRLAGTNFEEEALRVTENTGSEPTPVKRNSTPGRVQTFTNSNFKGQVVQASEDLPVLVEFYSKTCPACKMMEPILTKLAKEMGDKAIVGKVGPQERELFSAFNIRGVPTMFIVRNGEIQETFVGGRPKEMLVEALSSYASNDSDTQ